jgi:hypothetical protein
LRFTGQCLAKSRYDAPDSLIGQAPCCNQGIRQLFAGHESLHCATSEWTAHEALREPTIA